MFRVYHLDDPFNKTSNRTLLNTKRNTFNCGGYALGASGPALWPLPGSRQGEPLRPWPDLPGLGPLSRGGIRPQRFPRA